jgi:hypothetical protein
MGYAQVLALLGAMINSSPLSDTKTIGDIEDQKTCVIALAWLQVTRADQVTVSVTPQDTYPVKSSSVMFVTTSFSERC